MNRRGFFGRLGGLLVALKITPARRPSLGPATASANGIRGIVDNGTEMGQLYLYHRDTGTRIGFTELGFTEPGPGGPMDRWPVEILDRSSEFP